MGELSIKIRIADRDYPMRVDEKEEERLRIAGKLISERLKVFREQFGIEDKQDLLAMVAFESVADKLKANESTAEVQTEFGRKLTSLDDLLSSHT